VVRHHDATAFSDIIFARCPVPPLAFCHRRSLGLTVGKFDTSLYNMEDWELLKAMARSGAEFIYLPFVSGLYHIRADSRSRLLRPTDGQKSTYEQNWASGGSIYGASSYVKPKGVGKVAFFSLMSWLDPQPQSMDQEASSKAIAQNLKDAGFACEAFCLSKLASDDDVDFEKLLAARDVPFVVRELTCGINKGRLIFARESGIPVTVFRTRTTIRNSYDPEELIVAASFFDKFLVGNGFDALVLNYADPLETPIVNRFVDVGKFRDLVVTCLVTRITNGYLFLYQQVDYYFVPSRFARQALWDAMRVASHVLPIPVQKPADSKIRSPEPEQHVLFLYQDELDLGLVNEIAGALHDQRPDIPTAVSRFGISTVSPPTGETSRGLSNLRFRDMGDGHAMEEVYASTRLLVVPTSTADWFCREIVAAMLRGIPVVASNCGALPEIIDLAGYVLDVPCRHGLNTDPEVRRAELMRWVERVVELSDKGATYQRASESSISQGRRWTTQLLAEVYREVFSNLHHQPGPQYVPRMEERVREIASAT
jgi:glycosyltransferase involved in cell wall biosynthesis